MNIQIYSNINNVKNFNTNIYLRPKIFKYSNIRIFVLIPVESVLLLKIMITKLPLILIAISWVSKYFYDVKLIYVDERFSRLFQIYDIIEVLWQTPNTRVCKLSPVCLRSLLVN